MSAPTAAGATSTLHVYVNDVAWSEVPSFADAGPTDHVFVTGTDDADKVTVITGDGVRGARLPTGLENVRAQYRQGIGSAGNVRARQISLLQTRPLGVRDAINPMPASGGADRETRDQGRKNVLLGVMALDRLVSVQDYADFTRTFAGIGKAASTRLPYGNREQVHVTIAGAGDIAINPTSDLYRNLLRALSDLGDADVPVRVDSRELLIIALQAQIGILPGYL